MNNHTEQTGAALAVLPQEAPPTELYELLERIVESNRQMGAQLRNGLDQIANMREIIGTQQQQIDRLETAVKGQQAVLEAITKPKAAPAVH